ncbi:MAG: hypothetical protein IJU79_02990 [Desulfovibrionaceae bacterium]|nr:hypothetical protein [Desulfovibrionaceae bacterium]
MIILCLTTGSQANHTFYAPVDVSSKEKTESCSLKLKQHMATAPPPS